MFALSDLECLVFHLPLHQDELLLLTFHAALSRRKTPISRSEASGWKSTVATAPSSTNLKLFGCLEQ
jgi:hypothetical protein